MINTNTNTNTPAGCPCDHCYEERKLDRACIDCGAVAYCDSAFCADCLETRVYGQ